MIIDISDDYIKFCVWTFEEIDFTGLFYLAEKLNLVEKKNDYEYRLKDDIFKYILFKDDNVFINSFWAKEFCRDGGILKSLFVQIQIMIFEMCELYTKGLWTLDCFYNGKRVYPNLTMSEDSEGKTTKEMIKHYKKINRTRTFGCVMNTKAVKEHHSRLCCICGNKDILLFKDIR